MKSPKFTVVDGISAAGIFNSLYQLQNLLNSSYSEMKELEQDNLDEPTEIMLSEYMTKACVKMLSILRKEYKAEYIDKQLPFGEASLGKKQLEEHIESLQIFIKNPDEYSEDFGLMVEMRSKRHNVDEELLFVYDIYRLYNVLISISKDNDISFNTASDIINGYMNELEFILMLDSEAKIEYDTGLISKFDYIKQVIKSIENDIERHNAFKSGLTELGNITEIMK